MGAYRLRRNRLRGNGLRRHRLGRVRVRGSGRNLLTVLCLLSILRLLLRLDLLPILCLLSVLGIGLTVSRLLVLTVLVLLHRQALTILTLLSILPIPTIRRITILVRIRHRFLPLAA